MSKQATTNNLLVCTTAQIDHQQLLAQNNFQKSSNISDGIWQEFITLKGWSSVITDCKAIQYRDNKKSLASIGFIINNIINANI